MFLWGGVSDRFKCQGMARENPMLDNRGIPIVQLVNKCRQNCFKFIGLTPINVKLWVM